MKTLQTLLILVTFCLSPVAWADLSDNSMVPKEEMNFAKDYLSKIRNKDIDYVLSYVDTEISSQVTPKVIEEIANYFPEGKLLSRELIGSHVNTSNSTWTGNFTFEYHFEDGWAVANAALKRVGNKTTVIGFSVNQTQASQKELNKFEFLGKSALHYFVLFFACFVVLFIIYTLIVAIRTPIFKRKWLWVIFILGGVGAISLNWATGEYAFRILNYQLFGVGVMALGEHAPWVITTGFPLGAIVFWFRRKSLTMQSEANQSFKRDS